MVVRVDGDAPSTLHVCLCACVCGSLGLEGCVRAATTTSAAVGETSLLLAMAKRLATPAVGHQIGSVAGGWGPPAPDHWA